MTVEDRDQQITCATADIDDGLAAGEIACGGDRTRLFTVKADHRVIEVRRFLRLAGQILEDRGAKGLLHSGLAGLDGEERVVPSAPPPLAGKRQNGRARRPRGPAPQRGTERGQSKTAV